MDWLGSTRAVTQSATTIESYDHDPWGVLLSGRTLTITNGAKEGFTSKERDAESQLDYFGARYYLSALGRWGSVDPAAYADRTPEWSPYVYVRDEPAGMMDLWGLQGCSIENRKNCVEFTGSQAQAAFMETAKKGATVEKILQVAAVAAAAPIAVVGGAEVVTGAGLVQLGLRAAPAATLAGKGREAAGRVVDVASGTTVLGKFPNYLRLADELGAKRFNIPTELWNKMSKAEQWAANQKFLDRAIARGDHILLSDPVKNIRSVTGAFRQELDYLMSKGFRLSADGTRLIR